VRVGIGQALEGCGALRHARGQGDLWYSALGFSPPFPIRIVLYPPQFMLGSILIVPQPPQSAGSHPLYTLHSTSALLHVGLEMYSQHFLCQMCPSTSSSVHTCPRQSSNVILSAKSSFQSLRWFVCLSTYTLALIKLCNNCLMCTVTWPALCKLRISE
jgi:hypothetical protein